MEFHIFEEVVGRFTGDSSLIDQSIDEIYSLKSEKTVSDGFSNVKGWQKDINLNSSILIELRRMLLVKFSEYFKYYQCKNLNGFEFTKFFVNVNPPNAYNTMHHHIVGEFSGSFWLKSERSSGNLILLNPYPNSFMNTLMISPSQDFNLKWFPPQPNTGVFFNSNLVHYVDVNRSESDRISAAFHIKVF